MRHTHKRSKFAEEQLNTAVQCVLDGASLRDAEKLYGISRSTLARHCRKNRNETGTPQKSILAKRRRAPFTGTKTDRLVSDMIAGISPKKQRIPIDYEESIERCEPSERKGDGSAWYQNLLHSVSLQNTETTSLASDAEFSKCIVDQFFDSLYDVMKKLKFEPQDIWSAASTHCSVLGDCGNTKTESHMGSVQNTASAENGCSVTFRCAINAIGNSVPPAFIFTGIDNYPRHFLNGAPAGSSGKASTSQTDNFLEFLKHFEKYSKATRDSPVLLFVDNHEPTESFSVAEFADSNGILLLPLPNNYSKKLQPLELFVNASFKRYYQNICESLMISQNSDTVPIQEIAEVAGKALTRALTPSNIKNGFRDSGLYPLDRDIFQGDDFLPIFSPKRHKADKDGRTRGGNITALDAIIEFTTNDLRQLTQQKDISQHQDTGIRNDNVDIHASRLLQNKRIRKRKRSLPTKNTAVAKAENAFPDCSLEQSETEKCSNTDLHSPDAKEIARRDSDEIVNIDVVDNTNEGAIRNIAESLDEHSDKDENDLSENKIKIDDMKKPESSDQDHITASDKNTDADENKADEKIPGTSSLITW